MLKFIETARNLFKRKNGDEVSQYYYEHYNDEELEKLGSKRLRWLTTLSDEKEITILEALRLDAFMDDHEECISGGGCEMIITKKMSGIGPIVHVQCPVCGKIADITDVDSW